MPVNATQNSARNTSSTSPQRKKVLNKPQVPGSKVHDKISLHEQHLQREKYHELVKDAKIENKKYEKDAHDMDECTFEPQILDKQQPDRNLYEFLSHQQFHMVKKNAKCVDHQHRLIQEQEATMQPGPVIDSLSNNVVKAMPERRGIPTHDRLYQKGFEELRQKNFTKTPSPRKSPQRQPENHRGEDTKDALYKLNKDIQERKQIRVYQKDMDIQHQSNSIKPLNHSQKLTIENFKKDFRHKATQYFNEKQMLSYQDPVHEIEPTNHTMDFQESAQLMNDMGFLPDKLTNEMEQQLEDLYTVLNCPKNSPILAENLQNILMVIDGNEDRDHEVQDGVKNHNWREAGQYSQETGVFYFKQGDYAALRKHFEPMRLHRMQKKKGLNRYAHKKAPNEYKYQPYVSQKSKLIANEKRAQFVDPRENIVDQLLHPDVSKTPQVKANGRLNTKHIENVRAKVVAEKDKELTFAPKTLQKRNYEILRGKPQYHNGEDHNVSLYDQHERNLQKLDQKRIEIEHLNNQDGTYTPEINNYQPPVHNQVSPIKGADKNAARIQKGRQDKLIKQALTERSSLSPTKGMKAAKKQLKQEIRLVDAGIIEKDGRTVIQGVSHVPKQARTAFGAEGAQIPTKASGIQPVKQRPPLHQPKNQPSPERHIPQPIKEKAPSPVRHKKPAPKVPEHHEPEHKDDDGAHLVDKQLEDMNIFQDGHEHERDPKLYVDVNIGAKSGMQRIVVFEGDTPKELAKQFCEKHNLNEEMLSKLTTLLQQQIDGVLPKIVEDHQENEHNDEEEGE